MFISSLNTYSTNINILDHNINAPQNGQCAGLAITSALVSRHLDENGEMMCLNKAYIIEGKIRADHHRGWSAS